MPALSTPRPQRFPQQLQRPLARRRQPFSACCGKVYKTSSERLRAPGIVAAFGALRRGPLSKSVPEPLQKESVDRAVPEALVDSWPKIQAELRRAVGEVTYSLWLERLEPRGLADDGTVLLGAPDATRGWIADRFGRVLQISVAAVLGPETTVHVVGRSHEPGPVDGPAGRIGRALEGEVLHPKYTFDQFVIGDGNRLAHGAALAVAELPGQAYNPLFVYGPPGVGKTHLLHAIGNYATTYGGGLVVRYTTIESFTNAFINALQSGGTERFKALYRDVDLLLIDDVQFLERKAKTEEEFFHTFNAVHETGSQLVLSSDRLPRDMSALEDRLRERFEAGLVTDIAPPDFETRLTILRKRAQHDGVTLDDPAVLELIADRITVNVRQLEGALIRVVAFSSLTHRPVTTRLAEEVLAGLYPRRKPAIPSIRSIQCATCEAFGVSLEDVLGRKRSTRITWPRHVAMYLARQLTDRTLPAIGREFGDRDHTTVMNACRRTEKRIATDPDAHRLVKTLTDSLQSPHPDGS